MPFEQPKLIEKDPALEKFHQEIQGLKEEERKEYEKKEAAGESWSVHLRDLDVEELTADDAMIFEKFKSLDLGKEEFIAWRKQIMEEAEKKTPASAEGQKEDPRYVFSQYLANKIGYWEKWEKRKKEFEVFHQEIDDLREKELEKARNKEAFDPHMLSVVPERLTPRDKDIYDKFKEGSLKDSSEEFRKYREEVFEDSRRHFDREMERRKKIKGILDTLPTEEEKNKVIGELFRRFESVSSRTNFQAWLFYRMLDEYVKNYPEEKKARKQKEAPKNS